MKFKLNTELVNKAMRCADGKDSQWVNFCYPEKHFCEHRNHPTDSSTILYMKDSAHESWLCTRPHTKIFQNHNTTKKPIRFDLFSQMNDYPLLATFFVDVDEETVLTEHDHNKLIIFLNQFS